MAGLEASCEGLFAPLGPALRIGREALTAASTDGSTAVAAIEPRFMTTAVPPRSPQSSSAPPRHSALNSSMPSRRMSHGSSADDRRTHTASHASWLEAPLLRSAALWHSDFRCMCLSPVFLDGGNGGGCRMLLLLRLFPFRVRGSATIPPSRPPPTPQTPALHLSDVKAS